MADEVQPNISEPVLSFVNCVKQNPKRFTIKHIDEILDFGCGPEPLPAIIFKDTFTDEEWVCVSLPRGYRSIKGCQFLAEDEEHYIVKELENFYEGREKRFAECHRIRRQRKSIKERERLKGIYCQ